MRNLLLAAFAGTFLSVGIVGCFDKDTAEPEGDTDTDSDSDSDTDSDSDADSDADTDTTTDCTMNSGWPCSCQVDVCDDGTSCIGLQGLGDGSTGYCAAGCTGPKDSCPPTDYAATPYCGVGDGAGTYYCVLICDSNDQCPADQDCQAVSGGSLCHP